jgi:DNA processing protein
MSQRDAEARTRLAVLLAGTGRPGRRLVATIGAGEPLLERLAAAQAPSALLRTVRELLADSVPRLLDRLAAAGWQWSIPSDPLFPPLLKEIADPPLGLFVRGRLRGGPWVSLVGSRRATAYGRQVAHLLGEELARAGVVVVSGMARGIDAAAHQGALAAGGDTWAVWGTGPDRVYPPEHEPLADAIATTGALLTEYPPRTPPRRHHFPERNRLLAGIAPAVVVVEAGARSGALVTARQAVDEGRELYAVPGNIFSEQSLGPNALLRIGARPLLGPRELLEAVGAASPDPALAAEARTDWLLDGLPSGEAVTPDQLAERCARPIAEVLQRLLELELDGLVEREPDGRYRRARAALPGDG